MRIGMSDSTNAPGEAARPKLGSPLLLIACAVAFFAGAGGFLAVRSGLLDPVLAMVAAPAGPGVAGGAGQDAGDSAATGPAAFVFLTPMVISLGPESRSKHLKVTLAIDVAPGREAEVEPLVPRVIDILQGYLRAVDEREFEIPRSMERLRAQMLRRVQLVTPPGAARDLLIQEFILN